MLRLVSLFMVLLSMLAPALAQDDDRKKEWEHLQGDWKCVARDAAWSPKVPAGTHVLTVKDTRFTVRIKDLPSGSADVTGWGSSDGVFTIDPSQSPKRIDDKQEKIHWLGIYRMEGDKLVVAFRTIERPKSFDDKERTVILPFERVKK